MHYLSTLQLLTAVNPKVSIKSGECGIAFNFERLLKVQDAHAITSPPRNVWRRKFATDTSIKTGMQVFLNAESHHWAIVRCGPKSTHPVNKTLGRSVSYATCRNK